MRERGKEKKNFSNGRTMILITASEVINALSESIRSTWEGEGDMENGRQKSIKHKYHLVQKCVWEIKHEKKTISKLNRIERKVMMRASKRRRITSS